MKTMTLVDALSLAYRSDSSIYRMENPEFDVEVFRECRPVQASENIHQTAERLADQLGKLGLVVYVRRFGTGNARYSGHGNNGVERIEVRGWSMTGKGIRTIRGADRIEIRDVGGDAGAISKDCALRFWSDDVVDIDIKDGVVVLTPRLIEHRDGRRASAERIA